MDRPELPLPQLRAFLVLAGELHFGHPAARLGIAQPPLSQQIRRLEEKAGHALFAREPRRVRLTPAGREAVRHTLLDLMYSPAWVADHPGPYGLLGDPDMTAHARRGHLRAGHEHDAWDALPAIVAPTLILHGSQDRLTPVANLSLLAARIPDARTHVFPGARHAYFEECRPAASALVAGFLTGDIDGRPRLGEGKPAPHRPPAPKFPRCPLSGVPGLRKQPPVTKETTDAPTVHVPHERNGHQSEGHDTLCALRLAR